MGPLASRPGEFWGRFESALDLLDCEVRCMHATAPEHEVLTHTHEAPHFVFVPGGGYISSATDAPDLSRLPLLVFNPAGTRHRDRFLFGRGAFMTVTVGGALGASLAEGRAWTIHSPEALRIARRLELSVIRGTGRLECEGWLLGLIGFVSSPGSTGLAPAWLERAYDHIWSSTQELSVARVAEDAGVHPVHLARVFNDYLGCAPGEALRGRRLERAAGALGRSGAALADVAARFGFSDQSHMTRSFRAGFGMTPLAFRQSGDVARVQDESAFRV